MIYLDTNVLLSLFIHDSATERAERWFAIQDVPCATSEWVKAEFFGAVGLRRRKGELSAAHARSANEKLDARLSPHLVVLPVSNDATARAAEWLRDPDCSLQSGDALHLAIACSQGASALATMDERFAKAARRLRLDGLTITLISEKPTRVEQVRNPYRIGDEMAKHAPRVKPTAVQKKAARKRPVSRKSP